MAVSKPAPVAVALDAPDLETAARWAALVTPHVSTVKVGLELYLRYGPQVVATVRGASRVSVFLDLKLHDIPATVAGAARLLSIGLSTVYELIAVGELHVVHGHDNAPDGPLLYEDRSNLDTAAWKTGRLVIGLFDDNAPGGPVDFIAVTGAGVE